MTSVAQRWELLYNQTPLQDVARHFQGMRQSPFLMHYLKTVLDRCPPGSRTLETGIGSGYGAIWLSLRGVAAEGIDYAPGIVERAQQVNNILGGEAVFRVGDLFGLYDPDLPRYQVIHHQGVLEHFTAPQVKAALAQQVASAHWVVFSVPSVYYPFDPEFGDERLLPLEEWQHLLSDFDIETLTYYGDPQYGAREHILCVLRGQPVEEALLARMTPAPYLPGVSAIVHTRNEARQIEACLHTLRPWVDEIIVCDMESEDATVALAQSVTPHLIQHPRIANFDRARNVSALRAQHEWVFYLDADERVPSALGPALRQLIDTLGQPFDGLLVPFKHYFAGHWMQGLYPGYTAPRLLRNGRFVFNARLHSGAQVEGPIACFPADNPDLALVHYSYDSLAHYLDKLNRYTDGEAANMHRDGRPYSWQQAMRHFVQDFQDYYDRKGAERDGVHGFLYAFLSAFYRFEQHAKLFERRFQQGQLQPAEQVVPASVEEVLEFALAVVREKPLPAPSPVKVVADAPQAASLLWSGPLTDPSGYGEESRHFLNALEEVGVAPAAQILPWSQDAVEQTPEVQAQRERQVQRPLAPGFVQIIQNFPGGFQRHPQAGIAIGRTMFETDRLPQAWVEACNRMDAIWVPSEFNRQTFAQAGVDTKKLVVVPGCLDMAPFLTPGNSSPQLETLRDGRRFVFLSVFDWTQHKGWDVLLRAFLEAFEGRDDVALLLKVWSTMGYTPAQVQAQAQAYVQEVLDHDLAGDPRVRFVPERLTRAGLLDQYKGADAFVLPSRGEGWGRPYMEAMACGLPTLGTDWSGNTAFMTADNSYLFECDLVAVPEAGWREIPTYQGHRWAEPNVAHVRDQLRRVVEERGEARQRGQRAQEEIGARFTYAQIGPQMIAEIARLRETQHSPLALVRAGEAALKSREELAATSAIDFVRVRWEGAQFSWHSLAHVNRELTLQVLHSGQVELSLIPTEPTHFDPDAFPRFAPLASCSFAPLSQPAQVHVRHFFPPRFDVPEEGHLVIMQPWEYGFLPERWIAPLQNDVEEVWCYSRYVRDVYRASGIPDEKLHVLPLGVDTDVFQPQAPPFVFTREPGAKRLQEAQREDEPPFVFLFVGGTLHRKGIDILLDAYLKAFSAYDNVCLVIKDTGTETVYRGAHARERILGLVDDPTRPALAYTDRDLTPHQLAGIYTAAHCLVQPYRGEGFCLPALEAMACGLPVIVPAGGPTDDFVDETVGWRVNAAKQPFGDGRIGEWDCVGPTWMWEVAVDTLAKQMRGVYARQAEARQRGQAATERVRQHWTWQHAGDAILKRLDALRQLPPRKALPLVHAPVYNPTPGSPIVAVTGTAVTTGKARGGKRSGRAHADKPGKEVLDLLKRTTPTISLCMIVRNEERVLGDCLESVKPWVDEVIVVDTGSTDRTVAIAEAAGAKVFHFPWCDDFSAARNVSLSHACGDWLFWMDADDTLPAECGQRLHEIVQLAEERVSGFLMQVHIPPAPGDSGFTIVDHVKLFRNQPHLRFEGRIHEQILEPIYRGGGLVERTDLYVVHSGYDYSPEGQTKKRERDLTILQKDLEDRPDHPFVLFNIGMTAYHLKEWDKAQTALERCLALSRPHESTVRKVYAMLVGCHLEQHDLAQARCRLKQGLALFPRDPELLFRAGIVFRDLGDLERAAQHYVTLLTQRETGHIDSLDVSMMGFKAHHNLALIYQELGRAGEAELQWQAALQHNPTFVPSLLGLGELYLALRRFEDVRAIATRLETLAPEQAQELRKRCVA